MINKMDCDIPTNFQCKGHLKMCDWCATGGVKSNEKISMSDQYTAFYNHTIIVIHKDYVAKNHDDQRISTITDQARWKRSNNGASKSGRGKRWSQLPT